MAAQRQVPEQTSTLEFEDYASSKPVKSSVNAGWQNLIVRTYQEPQTFEHLIVPAVPDPHIVLQLSGSTCVDVREIGGTWTEVQIQPGQLFLTPSGDTPYEMRWVSRSNDPIETVHLHLNARFLAEVGAATVQTNAAQTQLLERSGIHDPLIEQLCLMLKQELETGGLGSKLYAESAAQLLAVHLLRQHCSFEHRIPEYRSGLPGDRLRRVTDYVQAHLDTDLSLDDLAQQVNMSAYHFARLFKQSTGESPNQYVTRQRIEAAKRLLRETELGVLDVALAVGYNSPSTTVVDLGRLQETDVCSDEIWQRLGEFVARLTSA
ncbi:helix-turn-helix transcriptional regulator, partial [Phormidium tenue FACHB-886]|nr:helix-turn-helix transcriptional regulator [Phormidium tenue FACHB-886]